MAVNRLKPKIRSAKSTMAASWSQDVLLALFVCQRCGIKFYDWEGEIPAIYSCVTFHRDPSNTQDPFCVEVFALSSPAGQLKPGAPIARKLGHVDRPTARWLSMLLQGPFRIIG